MENKLCIIMCSNFYREVKKIVEDKGYDNVIVKSFASECGVFKKTSEDSIKTMIEDNENDTMHYEIICSEGCINLKHGFSDIPCCDITQTTMCFNLLMNESLVNHYLKQRYYLVTPGWVNNWKYYVMDTWKFDKATAQEYFNDFSTKLLLLDTGVYDNVLDKLKEFSEFSGVEYDVIPVGLGYFELIIEKLVVKYNLSVEYDATSNALKEKNREIADYAMIFDLLRNLTRMVEEEVVIRNIFEIVRMLFGAGKVAYISLHNGGIKDLKSDPENIDISEVLNLFNRGFKGKFIWTESEKGFIVKIFHVDEVIGIVYIDDIPFEEYLDSYLNTFMNINEICGLAISNARNFHKIKQTQNKLQLQKAYFKQLFQNSPEAIIILDNDARILNVNSGFTDLFQYSLDEIEGKNYKTFIPEDRADECMACFYDVMSGNSVKVETTRLRKDGNSVDVQMLAYPIFNEGEQVGIYVIYSDITERKNWEIKLKDLAFNDSLTGLYTRRVFMDRLDLQVHKAERNDVKFAVVFIDINKFKEINDNYGHDVGDKILIEVGKRLRKNTRKSDTIARMGGDEFTMLLLDLKSRESAVQVVENVLASFTEKCILSDLCLTISASIGIAVYPNHGTDSETLMKSADLSMYEAKKSGESCYHIAE